VADLTSDEVDFLMHGSLATEVIPVRLLEAFTIAYPDIFPDSDMSNFGLIPDPVAGLPLGVSMTKAVAHLGGQDAVGINCVSCHMTEVDLGDGSAPRRIVGPAGQFDVNAFFGAVVVGMVRPQIIEKGGPVQMASLLSAWLQAGNPSADSAVILRLRKNLADQSKAIAVAIKGDPWGAKGAGAGGLHEIDSEDLRLVAADVDANRDLVPVARALLRLFHNIRATLHIPEVLPAAPESPGGPGRNDAFGLLAYSFFQIKVPAAPVKYGVAWNLGDREWVHWDGNNNDPIARNLAASLGLGAPIVDTHAILDFASVKRQTEITQKIRSPLWPGVIDAAKADRGKRVFDSECASCHAAGAEKKLFLPKEVGTDVNRSMQIDTRLAEYFQAAIQNVAIAGYTPSGAPPFRVTGRYWASELSGVWARAPFLHNGAVRTLGELLTPPAGRAVTSRRGTSRYDREAVGYIDSGSFAYLAGLAGNSPSGHEYGVGLSDDAKADLMEFLKSI
jgi:mono/diheme cytochrome c family protein